MSETAQQHLDRSLRDLAPHIEDMARAEGFAPPFRFHMIAVTREAQFSLPSAAVNRAFFQSVFQDAKREIGADVACMVTIPDAEARLTWVAAIEGVIA